MNALVCILLAFACPLALANNYYMLQPQPLDLQPANSIMHPMCEKDLCNEHYSYAPYTFGYTVRDSEHGSVQNREEHADGHGSVKGSYSYIDPHGIKRVVEYVADKGGFRAMIKTNEPGTKTSNPADAVYLSSAPQMSPHDEYMSMKSSKQGLLLNNGATLVGLGGGLGLGLGNGVLSGGGLEGKGY